MCVTNQTSRKESCVRSGCACVACGQAWCSRVKTVRVARACACARASMQCSSVVVKELGSNVTVLFFYPERRCEGLATYIRLYIKLLFFYD